MNGQTLEVQTHRVTKPVHQSPYRNVLSNWVGFIVSAGIAFFLSPFVVRHLGNSAYGVWVLIGSLTGYLGLMDLGVRSAVTRYISSFHALGNHTEAGRIASSALMIFASTGFVAVAFSVSISLFGAGLFRIPSSYRVAAQIILVIAGVNIAVSLVSGVFGGILVALQRFDLTNKIEVISSILRSVAIVVVLLTGHGLVSLALIQLIFAVLNCMIYAAVSLREYPQIRINLLDCDLRHLRLIFSFSFYAFLITISLKLIFYTDSIVIGYFLPVSFITFFAIAGNLLNYSRDLISGISTTAAPRASAMDAGGDREGLRRVTLKAAQFATIVMLPIAVTFLLRGKTFIRLWMGAEYAVLSGHVLVILTVASIFLAAEQVTGSTMMGIGSHRLLAKVYSAEALCNLGLSVLLVSRWGIIGVALGTALPSLAKSLFFWPWYMQRILDVPISEYIFGNWLRPGLGILPFAIATYITESIWPATHLAIFCAQTALIMPIAALGYWRICFDDLDREVYSQRFVEPLLKWLK